MLSKTATLILLTTLLMSSFITFVSIHSVAATSTRIYVDPPVVDDPSTFFNVSVKVDNLHDLLGAEFGLVWNPSLIAAINMTEVIFHQVTPQNETDNIFSFANELDNVHGTSLCAYTWLDIAKALDEGYAPISGNYTIFVIEFQVIGIGNCSLHFTISKLGDLEADPIAHDTVDGSFQNSIPPLPIPPPPPPEPQLMFSVDPCALRDQNLKVNSTFSINIQIDSVANHSGYIYYNFVLFWDPSLLGFVNGTDVVCHEVVGQADWQKYQRIHLNSTGGWVSFDCDDVAPSGYRPIFGNHTAAVFTFQVLNIGKCKLQISGCFAAGVAGTGYVTTSRDGYFSNTLSGDLNGDKTVDLYDALQLAKTFGSTPESKNWNEDADINGDGTVDMYDAILLSLSFGRKA